MKISLINAGKRFNRDWIFRNIHYAFTAPNAYAITGPNGSGKSTLLQVIAGAIVQSEGGVEYEVTSYKVQGTRHTIQDAGYKVQVTGYKEQEPEIAPPVTGNMKPATENYYTYISIAAPYLEVIEEMTMQEFLSFHGHFKPFLPGMDSKKIIAAVGLENAAGKQIRYYSSGMKQRVRLAQAIFSDVPCVLLDEPCTNLDAEGIALYHRLINEYCKERLVIVSSNDEQEYRFCKEKINIMDWKK